MGEPVRFGKSGFSTSVLLLSSLIKLCESHDLISSTQSERGQENASPWLMLAGDLSIYICIVTNVG